jgi:alpha-1,6-mannosyltransferase
MLTIGGYSYARMPQGTAVTASRPVQVLLHLSAHRSLGLGLAACGLMMLTWAWSGLRRFAADEETGVSAVRAAVAAWCPPLLIAPPLFSGDGWSYVATGYLTGRGLSPYVWTPSVLALPLRSGVNSRWIDTPSPYGPLALGWGGIASQATSNPWLLLFAYRLFAILGVVLLAWSATRLAHRSGVPEGTASWLAVANPFVLAHGVGGLHNDVVVAGLGAAALAVSQRGAWRLGAVLAGAAAAVKIPGGLVAVGVVLLSVDAGAGYLDRIRRSVQVASLAGAIVIGLGMLSGVGAGWIPALTIPGSVPSRLSPTSDVATVLSEVLRVTGTDRLLGNGSVLSIVQDAGIGVVLAIALALLIGRRDRGDVASLRAVAGLMLLATMLSPVVHYWYGLWCLPLLACVALADPLRGALVGGVTALGLVALVDPSLHLGWITTTALVVIVLGPVLGYAAAVFAQGRQPRFPGSRDGVPGRWRPLDVRPWLRPRPSPSDRSPADVAVWGQRNAPRERAPPRMRRTG